MGSFRFILRHALWGFAVGGLLAVSTPVCFIVVAVLWASVFIELIRTKPVGQRWPNGLAMLSTQLAAIAGAITIAALAPVKTQRQLQESAVALPKSELGLSELNELMETGQFRVPALRSISFPESEAMTRVRWPAKELTLGEFIAAIEEQTPLRARFRSCGNGLTILWGNDCAFGFSLDVPARP